MDDLYGRRCRESLSKHRRARKSRLRLRRWRSLIWIQSIRTWIRRRRGSRVRFLAFLQTRATSDALECGCRTTVFPFAGASGRWSSIWIARRTRCRSLNNCEVRLAWTGRDRNRLWAAQSSGVSESVMKYAWSGCRRIPGRSKDLRPIASSIRLERVLSLDLENQKQEQ